MPPAAAISTGNWFMRRRSFTEYFRQATPIDLIEQLRLGSRPSRRSSKNGAHDIHDLRAIPWVFAWTQSRHFLPSWYGLGHAFENFAAAHGSASTGESGKPEWIRTCCARCIAGWPFFAVLIDNAEMSLAKTDLYIAARYAALVRPKQLGQTIFRGIEEEFQRSVRVRAGDLRRQTPARPPTRARGFHPPAQSLR